jgi:predicted nucleic acid-binding protein
MRRGGNGKPRRVLVDFLIGAYVEQNGFRLLTFDRGIHRTAFPKLKLLAP